MIMNQHSNSQALKQTKDMNALVDSALAVLQENGFIEKVFVRWDAQVANDRGTLQKCCRKCEVLVFSTTTIAELKSIVRQYSGIAEEDQCLYLQGSLQLTVAREDTIVFSGTIAEIIRSAGPSVRRCWLQLRLHTTRFDTRFKSQLELVGLGDWKERDEIMGRMMNERRARHCWQGHALREVPRNSFQALLLQQQQRQRRPQSGLICAKCDTECHKTAGHRRAFVCTQCPGNETAPTWLLCLACHRKDAGWPGPAYEDPLGSCNLLFWQPYVSRNPYKSLANLACQINNAMVSTGCRQFSHSCFTSKQDTNTKDMTPEALKTIFLFASDFTPLQVRKRNMTMHYDKKVLPDGIRFILQFGSEERSILLDAGYEEAVETVELSMILQNGATIRELLGYICSWEAKAPDLWPILKEEFCQRHATRRSNYPIDSIDPSWKTRTMPAYDTWWTVTQSIEGCQLALFEIVVPIDDGDY